MSLLDQYVAGKRTPGLREDVHAEIHRLRYKARSFVFTPEASAVLGKFAYECPDIILDHRQFARAPYETTYLQIDGPAFYSSFPKTSVSGESDTQIGYLLNVGPEERTDVISLLGAADGNRIAGQEAVAFHAGWQFSPAGTYVGGGLGRPIIFGDKDDRLNDWNYLATALGTALHAVENEEQRQQIIAETSLRWYGDKSFDPLQTSEHGQVLHQLLQNSAGDLRNVWAALLWLNQPGKVVKDERPRLASLHNGKRVVYMAHHVVDIRPGRKAIRGFYLKGGPRTPPRGHEVSGHWRSSGGVPECTHAWPLLPDVDGHWKCPLCGKMRWWVDEYNRGDATRGWVTKEYRVKT